MLTVIYFEKERIIETVNATEDINRRKCEQLKNCIDSYLSKSEHLTLQNVADKTSVPYSTIRRIVGLKGNPQPETAIKICNALGEDSFLYTYMKEFHPDIARVMSATFSHNQEFEFVSNQNREYFTSENYFLILNLAYTQSGTTEEEVLYELGMRGLERLSELVEQGLVIKDTEGRYFGSNNKYKMSFADTKKRIELAMNYYRLEEAGSLNNWMSFQTESLNVEGLKVLKKLEQKQFNERKDQVFYNPMYNGDIKVYSASVYSTFLSYADKGELQ